MQQVQDVDQGDDTTPRPTPPAPSLFVCIMQGGGRVLLAQSRPPRLCLWLPDRGVGAQCDLVSADPATPCPRLVGAAMMPISLSCAWVLSPGALFSLRLHALEAAVTAATAKRYA